MPTRSEGRRCFCSLCPTEGRYFPPHEFEIHKSRLAVESHSLPHDTPNDPVPVLPRGYDMDDMTRRRKAGSTSFRSRPSLDILRSVMESLELEFHRLEALYHSDTTWTAQKSVELEDVEQTVLNLRVKAEVVGTGSAKKLKEEIARRCDTLDGWLSELKTLSSSSNTSLSPSRVQRQFSCGACNPEPIPYVLVLIPLVRQLLQLAGRPGR